MKLFEEKLGELDPGFGVELMILSAPEVEDMDRLAGRAARGGTLRNPLGEDGTIDLADRLALRLGEDNVVRLLPRDSHMPERVQTTAPISAPAAAEGAWARLASMKGARPTRLLQRPEPVEVTALLPDDPPRQFHWRRHAHKVVKVEGPERIADEWWRPRPSGKVMPANIVPPVRDYYRVEDDDGGRFWLFRDGPLNARQVVPARLLRVMRRCRAYAELQVTTNYSFLRGGSHPGELVFQAASLGHYAIGIADRNTLAGVVRAYRRSRNSTKRPRIPEESWIKLLVGARLETRDGYSLLAYPMNLEGYKRLSRLLSQGNRATRRRANATSPSRSSPSMPTTSWPSSCRRASIEDPAFHEKLRRLAGLYRRPLLSRRHHAVPRRRRRARWPISTISRRR